MVSSHSSFNGQRTVHQILGGGFVADVLLWKRINVTVNLVLLTVFSWTVFEIFGYTFITFSSSVLFLLSAILFFWAKSAAILNRSAPPLPNLYISEELADVVEAIVRDHANSVLSLSRDIALGKDPKLFIRVSAFLCISSVVGSWAGFWTICYTCVILVLTLPALYEKFEDPIQRLLMAGCLKLQGMCGRRFDVRRLCN